MTSLLPSSAPAPSAFARGGGGHAHLGKVHAILSRCYGAASREAVAQSQRAIREHLERHGISFEGKRLRVALTPTLLARAEIETLAPAGAQIRAALLAVIAQFLDEHRAVARADAPLHRFFAPYARWWDLIAAEARASEAIQLMRYDAIREDRGRWQLLETNTCCPGGTIHCARVRTAWLASPLGVEATTGVSLVEHPVDRADGFLRHLHQLASSLEDGPRRGAPPRIAICSYRGSYQNEVASLVAEQARLIEAGELPGAALVIGDARELQCEGDVATLHGQRVDLIYNKLDPLMVDPRDPELAGWVRAVASPRVELVNSLAAMYLTETKRVLALLRDEDLRGALALDAATRAAIDALVPRSHVLPDPRAAEAAASDWIGELSSDRHRYVLKADASTRGAGIYIGRELSPAAWAEAMAATVAANGIVQECADIPHRLAVETDAETGGDGGEPLEEYWGVDLFYFGDRFGGCVSRCHSGMVFNVGNGGKEAPALVVA